MTIPLIQQIESAEHDLPSPPGVAGVPAHTVRETGARLIRSGAARSLELANRLDPPHRTLLPGSQPGLALLDDPEAPGSSRAEARIGLRPAVSPRG